VYPHLFLSLCLTPPGRLDAEAVGIAYDSDRRTIFVANSVGTLQVGYRYLSPTTQSDIRTTQMFNLGIGGNELKAYPSMSFETAEEKQSTFKLSVVTHRCVGKTLILSSFPHAHICERDYY